LYNSSKIVILNRANRHERNLIIRLENTEILRGTQNDNYSLKDD